MLSSLVFLLILLSLSQLIFSQCPPETLYRRTLDGSCNNLGSGKERLGASKSLFIHTREGTAYANDSGWFPVSEGRPSPRRVSLDLLGIGPDPVPQTAVNGLSLLATAFGNLVAHDFTLTPRLGEATETPGNDSEVTPEIAVIPIHLEPDDPFLFFPFPPNDPKPLAPDFIQQRIGDFIVVNGTRQFFNNQTHYLDASTIYSRNKDLLPKYLDGAKFLLEDRVWERKVGFFQGQNITLTDILPSVATTGAPFEEAFHLRDPPDAILVSGDERASENVGLNLMHLLFAREHNLLVDELALEHPDWNDIQLFEKARVINIAQYQHIIYKEYLPAVFGRFQTLIRLGPYTRYKDDVDPSVSHLFATSAMRFGHTTIPEKIPLYDECGNPDETKGDGGHLKFGGQVGILKILGFHAIAGGVDEVAKALLYTPLEVFDHRIHANMRDINLPFPTVAGVDVVAANMNRARWNGVPGWDKVYDAWNDIPGLEKIYGRGGCTSTPDSPPPDDLECFTMWMNNDTLANLTRQTYGKVSAIDPWYAFLVEKKAFGSSLGRTATKVLLDQFKRARDGDRFFYLRLPFLPEDPLFGTPPLTWRELSQVLRLKMSDLIKRNFGVDRDLVQPSAFHVPSKTFFDSCEA